MSSAREGGGTRPISSDDSSDREISVRRTLNALEMSSGLISALVRNPGPLGERQSIVDAAKAMLRSSDVAAQALIKQLGLEDVPSAHYSIMRSVSRAVADKWRATSGGSSANADVSDLLAVWVEVSKADVPASTMGPLPVDELTSMKISLLDAMLPVIREISVFDLFHDQRKAGMHARALIVGAVDGVMKGVASNGVSDESRHQLKSALLRNAGAIYASAWRRQADELSLELASMDREDRIHSIDSFKNGYPLNKVDASFVSSFQRLTELVHFLTPPVRAAAVVAG